MSELNELLQRINRLAWCVYAEVQTDDSWQVQVVPAGRCANKDDPWHRGTLLEALRKGLAWAEEEAQ